jgi:4'-phosphopantetheinyl transferase
LSDAVHVWSIDTVGRPPAVAHLATLLDDDERRRADALLCADERLRFLVTHGAARILVGRHLGVPPDQLRWRYGPNGKPELAGVRVSLSHSGDRALLALTDRRAVGVDVETLPPDRTAVRLAARFFPDAEARFVAAGRRGEQAGRFARLWVRKEACVKAAGARLVEGLPLPVHSRDVVAVGADRYLLRDLAIAPDCRAALAVAGTSPVRLVHQAWAPRT